MRVAPEGPTEVADVAHSINELAAALESSEARERAFLLSVSHELRTPLTAVKGFGEALADGVTDDPQQAGEVIVGEAARLERLVADLLDLARLGADDFHLDPVPVDLVDLVGAAATVWSARCAEVGVAFRVELPTGRLVVVTDGTRLRQIIDGLAENALRVTPAGRPIVLALHEIAGAAVLEVRDGGPGLSADDRSVAFERSALWTRYRGVRRVGTGSGAGPGQGAGRPARPGMLGRRRARGRRLFPDWRPAGPQPDLGHRATRGNPSLTRSARSITVAA